MPRMTSHETTLRAIFRTPVRPVKYRAIESLLLAHGFEKDEGSGSRLRFSADGGKYVLTLHRPHGSVEALPGLVRRIRDVLEKKGIRP